MRLNLDCVRDILLCVEDNTGLRQSCFFVEYDPDDENSFFDDDIKVPEYQLELRKKYEHNELIYHVQYCIRAGLIANSECATTDMIQIEDLTPKGHEFIANIRSESVWNKVKAACAKIGVASLPSVFDIATKVTAMLVDSYHP